MSHNLDIKTQITDKVALCRALERMGFKNRYEVHDKAQTLNNWRGYAQDVRAEIIIRKRELSPISNDFGFSKQEDGSYKIIVDTGYIKNQPDWTNRLTTYYGVEKMKLECESRGQKYYEDTDEKNRPRLRIKTGSYGSVSSAYSS